MSEEQPPHPDEHSLIPIDYRAPDLNRPAGGIRYSTQVWIGVAAFVWAVAMGAGAGNFIYAAKRDLPLSLLCGAAVPVVLLSALGIVAWVRWRWRGLVIGVLAALGVSALVFGLCVASFLA